MNITLYDERDFVDVIKLRPLDRAIILDYPGKPVVITWILIRRKQQLREEVRDIVTSRWGSQGKECRWPPVAGKDKEGFPGGPVVKNQPANAGDTGLIPGLGKSHMSPGY